MKIEKTQFTQTITTVTLESFQECELLRIIVLAAKNKIKEDEVGGSNGYCGYSFNVIYSYIDKLREVANK